MSVTPCTKECARCHTHTFKVCGSGGWSGAGGEDGDRLTNLDGLRALVADREHLNTGVTRNDLDSLRGLRGDIRAFFVACADGDGEDAAARLNALLIQHPV